MLSQLTSKPRRGRPVGGPGQKQKRKQSRQVYEQAYKKIRVDHDTADWLRKYMTARNLSSYTDAVKHLAENSVDVDLTSRALRNSRRAHQTASSSSLQSSVSSSSSSSGNSGEIPIEPVVVGNMCSEGGAAQVKLPYLLGCASMFFLGEVRPKLIPHYKQEIFCGWWHVTHAPTCIHNFPSGLVHWNMSEAKTQELWRKRVNTFDDLRCKKKHNQSLVWFLFSRCPYRFFCIQESFPLQDCSENLC